MRRVRTTSATVPPRWTHQPCPHCGAPMRVPNGAWLRYLRERARIDQRTFAQRLRASGPYISDIERNRRACPLTFLQAYQRLGRARR